MSFPFWLGCLFSLFCVTSTVAAQDMTDLPRASRLHGRELPANLSPFSSEVRTNLARMESGDSNSKTFNPATISEMTRLKAGATFSPEINVVPTFKQMVSGVPVAGSLVVVKSYLLVPPEYVRTIEQIMRLNLSLPIFARTMTSTATVTYSFTVRQDGKIIDLEKERTTGSPALDNTIQSLLTTISPVDLPRGINLNPSQSTQPLVRLRFTLTYRPSI